MGVDSKFIEVATRKRENAVRQNTRQRTSPTNVLMHSLFQCSIFKIFHRNSPQKLMYVKMIQDYFENDTLILLGVMNRKEKVLRKNV